MEWYTSYAIGIDIIDTQHQELVRLISGLQNSLRTGKTTKAIGNAIKFLVDYTKRHFSAEEEVMQSINYSEYETHKKLHGKLIQEITDILIDLKKGKAIDVYQLIDFLTDWLINHIRDEDHKIGRAYAAFAASNGPE